MATTIARADASQPPLRVSPSRGWLAINVRELWTCRELLYFFIWRDVKIRSKQTAIGAAWAVLQPFLIMLVFSLIFCRISKLPTNGLPSPAFYYCARLPWTHFSTALRH